MSARIKLQPQGLYLTALLLFSAGLLFYGSGRMAMIGPDEPRYAEVAREMYVSGDWITPRLGGIHWFEKPALAYWLIATGYALFGVSEWAARMFVSLAAAAAVFSLYLFGRRVKSGRYGYLSAVTLLSSGIWFAFGRAATFDIPLAATMMVALLAFYLWDRSVTEESDPQDLWWFVCCLALGLAVLAKGLIGIVLPAGIIALYLLLTRRLLNLLRRPALLSGGGVIFLAVTSTWYGPMFARHGSEFWNEFFLAHHFQRYLTNRYQHPQPFYFFPLIALLGCLPWSMHLITAAQQALRRGRIIGRTKTMTEADRRQLFLWLWTLLPIIFFSFSGSKLPGYILPVFPAIALLIGGVLDELWNGIVTRQFRWMSAINGLLLLVAGLYMGLRGSAEIGAGENAALIVAVISMTVAAIHLTLLGLGKERAATLWLPAGVVVIVIAASHLLFAGLGRQESMRELSHLALQSARPGERLVFYINTEQSLNFYAPDLPLRDEKAAMLTPMKPAEIAAIMQSRQLPELLVISLARWEHEITQSGLFAWERLGRQQRINRHGDGLDDLVLLRVRSRTAGD